MLLCPRCESFICDENVLKLVSLYKMFCELPVGRQNRNNSQ